MHVIEITETDTLSFAIVWHSAMKGTISQEPLFLYLCTGGGVCPVLSQTHERHRGDALQHELHQQQLGVTRRRAV